MSDIFTYGPKCTVVMVHNLLVMFYETSLIEYPPKDKANNTLHTFIQAHAVCIAMYNKCSK